MDSGLVSGLLAMGFVWRDRCTLVLVGSCRRRFWRRHAVPYGLDPIMTLLGEFDVVVLEVHEDGHYLTAVRGRTESERRGIRVENRRSEQKVPQGKRKE